MLKFPPTGSQKAVAECARVLLGKVRKGASLFAMGGRLFAFCKHEKRASRVSSGILISPVFGRSRDLALPAQFTDPQTLVGLKSADREKFVCFSEFESRGDAV